jgi:hypothetical protein
MCWLHMDIRLVLSCGPTNALAASSTLSCMKRFLYALQGTSQLSWGYWLGLTWDEVNQLWIWSDGDDAGNGEVNNNAPYSHW